MDESELLAILTRLERQSLGGEESELELQRERAEDYYLGRAVGRLAPTDDPDRSRVVSRDVYEAVEWTMPELLRIFVAEDAVEFDASGPDDTDSARQQTRIVNHVVLKKNPGFLIFSTWFRDALIQKNGYVKAYWDDRTTSRVEEYESLSLEQMMQLEADSLLNKEEIEILEQEQTEMGLNVRLRIRAPAGQVVIENIPPERIRVAEDARFDLQKASYVAQIDFPTRSDLVTMGISPAIVDDLPAHQVEDDEDQNRNTVEDEGEEAEIDRSMQKVRVVEAYVRIDHDGDGEAELRRVLYTGDTVLSNEEWTNVPFAHLTPIPRPHRHVGLSFYDVLCDIQEIQTVLKRQLLDNVFGANHNGMVVNDDVVVDWDDFLTTRPNARMRVRGRPSDAVMPLGLDNVSHRILPIIQYYESQRESRTGTGRASQGLDADVLRESTAGAFEQGLAAASALKEMIARTFAETGVKDLMLLVHRLMIEHQDHEQLFRINNLLTPAQLAMAIASPDREMRMKAAGWVPVDPRQWKHRSDMTANVGLGHNSRDEEIASLLRISALAEKGTQVPIVTQKNLFNLAEDIVRASGFPNRVMRYFTPPEMIPPKEPQENPLVTAERIKQRARLISDQLRTQAGMTETAVNQNAEMKRHLMNFAAKVAELELQFGVDLMREGIGRELEFFNLGRELAREGAQGNGSGGVSGQSGTA